MRLPQRPQALSSMSLTSCLCIGAIGGNRTRTRSLEGCCTAVIRLPHFGSALSSLPSPKGTDYEAYECYPALEVLVGAEGVEPSRYFYQRILNPSCLPIPTCRHIKRPDLKSGLKLIRNEMCILLCNAYRASPKGRRLVHLHR